MTKVNRLKNRLKKLIFFVGQTAFVLLIITGSVILIAGLNNGSFIHAESKKRARLTENVVDSTKEVEKLKPILKKKIQKGIREEENKLASKMEGVFKRYGGHMSGLAKLIVNNAKKCGGDPKIIFAIAGNESGFGRIPYKLYNPFGYLDRVQYASWEDAVSHLSCKISKQHLVPCSNNLTCIINRYGGTDTNKPKWISNVTFFINLLN